MLLQANYYFDIETTGLKENEDKIITIQYQKLDLFTGKPIGNLIIWKEWESSEKEILRNFVYHLQIGINKDVWNFVPTGFNLSFEHKFLKAKSIKYGFPEFDIINKPALDLKTIGVIMNQGQFRGASLDNLTGKKGNGVLVVEYYKNKEYDKIIQYIEQESKEFLKFNSYLYQEMPKLLAQFKQII